ncbi:GNAT family N-acetyltransferase [Nocardia abscessus]|uniref:GNAT family N-acetyltransferase n=1 Tax=Nocardia abscessus TaxID=120957 RepID=UPI002453B21B|nr:GNAT family N-acetyltransferase [Nocardia abscessus]
MHGERAWVLLVALASRWRGRGIGSALLAELERRLRSNGVRRICRRGGQEDCSRRFISKLEQGRARVPGGTRQRTMMVGSGEDVGDEQSAGRVPTRRSARPPAREFAFIAGESTCGALASGAGVPARTG